MRAISSRALSSCLRDASISRRVKTYGEVMAERAAVGVACTGLKMVADDGKESALRDGIDMEDIGGIALNKRTGRAKVLLACSYRCIQPLVIDDLL